MRTNNRPNQYPRKSENKIIKNDWGEASRATDALKSASSDKSENGEGADWTYDDARHKMFEALEFGIESARNAYKQAKKSIVSNYLVVTNNNNNNNNNNEVLDKAYNAKELNIIGPHDHDEEVINIDEDHHDQSYYNNNKNEKEKARLNYDEAKENEKDCYRLAKEKMTEEAKDKYEAAKEKTSQATADLGEPLRKRVEL
ncbi:uncharacterized protein LOC115714451 isoform X2 [Cannabis sativa]|uniref:uncharacterized protein LOC115714451 isoform X2 n=1 Tax=Cannabis sativa TaxID=3483 RepID=UPI0029CA3D1F|nr:uncharacterized protein LOC115714451 isoform X2 [Cannabis sativa]